MLILHVPTAVVFCARALFAWDFCFAGGRAYGSIFKVVTFAVEYNRAFD